MVTKAVLQVARCLIGSAALISAFAPPIDAKSGFNPVIIRGTGRPDTGELRLAYQASFPNGSLQSSVDHLGAGAMQMGDTLIAGSNPTFERRPGELFVSIARPVALSPDLIVAESAWATGVAFGPGSVSRISVTCRAPVGPIPGGGFAIGLVAKTGGKDDLAEETRIAVTINVRPGFLVRLNVPFGSTEPTSTVLPPEVRDAIFSASDPEPFTLDLTVDRVHGKGTAKLTVGSYVRSLDFTLADFLADKGPAITAMGAGIAVNSNGPGQTASVNLRDFRIYTNADGMN